MSNEDEDNSVNGDPGPSAYNNTHRAFLQALISQPLIAQRDAIALLSRILAAGQQQQQSGDASPPPAPQVDEPLLRNYIHTLNDALGPLDFEVRRSVHQRDADRLPLYALVSTASDTQTRLATGLSADEVAFVRRVLDAMFLRQGGGDREVFAVRATEAVRLAKVAQTQQTQLQQQEQEQTQSVAPAASITMQRAEEVLREMCGAGWFERSEAGYVSLGPRGIMELKGWLQGMYDEPEEEGDTAEDVERGRRVRFCEACKEMLTVVSHLRRLSRPVCAPSDALADIAAQGLRCSNHDCGFRVHEVCAKGYFRARGERQCPRCGTEWTGSDAVGEKAAIGYGSRDRRSNGTSRRSTNTLVADESE